MFAFLEMCHLISTYFGIFLVIFLLLMSTLIPLWSEKKHCMISILNLLRLKMWSILVNVPWELEKSVCHCCWMKQSMDVTYIQLIDGAIEFNHLLTHFRPAGSVYF